MTVTTNQAATVGIPTRRLVRARRFVSLLVTAAALMPMALSLHGMISVGVELLGLSRMAATWVAGFLELAVIASGWIARYRAMRGLSGGADRVAMWVFCLLSGAFSGLYEVVVAVDDGFAWHVDPGSSIAAGVRLIAPLVACWLWERLLDVDRIEHAGRSLQDVLRDRRYLAVARAALAVRRATEVGGSARVAARARRRLDRAHMRALRAVPPAPDLGGVLAAVAAVDHLPAATLLDAVEAGRQVAPRRARVATRRPQVASAEGVQGQASSSRLPLTAERSATLVELTAQGFGQRAIAERLGTSKSTVARLQAALREGAVGEKRPALDVA